MKNYLMHPQLFMKNIRQILGVLLMLAVSVVQAEIKPQMQEENFSIPTKDGLTTVNGVISFPLKKSSNKYIKQTDNIKLRK